MTISILAGVPGAGKSYDAVLNTIIPALAAGRVVRTNLPLNEDAIAEYLAFRKPGFELKFSQVQFFEGTAKNPYPFLQRETYNFDMDTETVLIDGVRKGPLFVIDEAQNTFPARQQVPLDIVEFFTEHRHYLVDIVLITQNYRNLAKEIYQRMTEEYVWLQKAKNHGTTKAYERRVFPSPTQTRRDDLLYSRLTVYSKKIYNLYFSFAPEAHAAGGKLSDGGKWGIPKGSGWIIAGLVFCLGAGGYLVKTQGGLLPAFMQSPASRAAKQVAENAPSQKAVADFSPNAVDLKAISFSAWDDEAGPLFSKPDGSAFSLDDWLQSGGIVRSDRKNMRFILKNSSGYRSFSLDEDLPDAG